MESSVAKLKFGNTFTLTGSLLSSAPSCGGAQVVKILRTVVGTTTSVLFDALSANAAGTFSKGYPADVSATYTAHVDGTTTCAAADSNAVPVLVKVAVSIGVSDQEVPSGARVKIKGSVAPCGNHAGTKVSLFKTRGGKLVKIDSARLSDVCKARWTKRVRKSAAFQVRWPQQDRDHLKGRSPRATVTVT